MARRIFLQSDPAAMRVNLPVRPAWRATFEELIRGPEDEPGARGTDAAGRFHLVITNIIGIELAHEALIREWPTLRAWLDEDREGLLIARHLSVSAQTWNRHGPGSWRAVSRCAPAPSQAWTKAHPDQFDSLRARFPGRQPGPV